MSIVMVHNQYQQQGGEDLVFQAESSLLEERGHEVIRYAATNDDIAEMSAWRVATKLFWNRDAYDALRSLLRRVRPEVIHFHNTFPLISPAAYYAAREEGIPIVQTLHNYRLVCPGATLFRSGRTCDDCLGRRTAWPGVLRGCYRQSRFASAAVAAMVGVHRAIGTWQSLVDVYICMSDFARDVMVRGGLPAEKLVVKPNFVHPDPGPGQHKEPFALFVGRLSEEKGVDVLLNAWWKLDGAVPLVIAGDGPLASDVRLASETIPNILWTGGRLSSESVRSLMNDASFLVCPSVCPEGCPLVVAEAFATGLPVLASDTGSLQSMVAPGRTGEHFHTGDTSDLASAALKLARSPDHRRSLGESAREEFVSRYSAEAHYENVMEIYERAKKACAEGNVRLEHDAASLAASVA